MSDLSDLYRAKMRFDKDGAIKKWAQLDAGRGETWDWVDGAQRERNRTAKIDEAVAKLIEAAEGFSPKIMDICK